MPIRKVVYAILLGSVVVGSGPEAGAEVVTDGTMGAAGALAGPDFTIPGTLGTQVGSSLFHSFSTFNLASGESATFSGPGAIGDVIARVTGGSSSSLNGALRCTIPGANLFFLNPAGILFGPEASLDLTGSFHASTATTLALGTTGVFDVANPANDLLTIAPPQAFGFVSAHPGQITMDTSTLRVVEGETLSLIGGKLTLVNSGDQPLLQAPGGGVNLVAVGAPGQVGLVDSRVDSDGLSGLGTLTITNTAGLTPGSQRDIDVGSDLGGGGEISIHAGRFVVDGASLSSETGGSGPGGDITIEARTSLLLENGALVAAKTYSQADGGSILVTTPELTVDGGSKLVTTTWDDSALGAGQGGDLRIDAVSLTVRGFVADGDDLIHSAIYSSSRGTAPAGDIEITAQTVTVEEEGWLSSDVFASGPGGNLRITAEDIWVGDHGWVSTDTFGSGQAGSLDLRAGFVGVGAGGKITSDSYGSGDAGRVAIQADGVGIYVGGYTEVDGAAAFSAIRTETFGSGRGGEISLTAPAILVEDGGGIDSRSAVDATGRGGDISIDTDILKVGGYLVVDGTVYRSDINASSYGVGEAGDITILAGGVAVEDEAVIFSDANGAGAGGHLLINAEWLEVTGHGWISSDSYGAGDAGRLEVEAGEVAVTDGGRITSDTYDTGKAGDLSIQADEILVSGLLEIDGEPYASKISSDAVGSGRGGAITLDAPLILVEDGGGIESRSRYAGSGAGGNISITADELRVRSVGEVNASSFGGGAAGDITIAAGSVTLAEVGTIASFANGTGDGGNISITSDSLRLEGVGESNNRLYRSLINASSYGEGEAGDIGIKARTVTLAEGGGVISLATSSGDGGTISVSSDELNVTGYGTESGLVGKSIIDASSEGTGAAGDIVIDAGTVSLTGAGTIASTAISSGNGGDIAITADTLAVEGWAAVGERTFVSSLDASSRGAGMAGDITIGAGTMTVRDAGSVNSLAFAGGQGGNIAITADALTVSGYAFVNEQFFLSSIDASSLGEGAAGGIAIDAGRVTVAEAGSITSLAKESGQGGDIAIRTDDLVVTGYTDLYGAFFRSCIDSSTYGKGAAGTITIDAATVTIADEARLASLTTSTGAGGGIAIRTDTLAVTGAATVNGITYASSINASSSGGGTAGDIDITAGTISLEGAGAIETYAQGSGAGGNIRIAADRLGVRGYALGDQIYQSIINASSYGAGAAGDISIGAREVAIAEGGTIATLAFATGNGGDIALSTGSLDISGYGRSDQQFSQSSINASSFGAGDAGDIAIGAGTVTLADSGAIASVTGDSGAGGHISLTADALTVTGQALEQGESYHSIITASSAGSGRAGDIAIGASSILLEEEGGIASSARSSGDGGAITLTADELTVRGGAAVNASSYGPGAAGDIVANAATIRLEDKGAILSMATASGNGGTIALAARESLVLHDAGLTTASTSIAPEAGKAGNILLRAGDLLRLEESVVATSSENADGGDIAIDYSAQVRLIDSEITTSVQGGTGNGGNIALSTGALVLGHSTVSANAYGGNGGNITINADLLLKDPKSRLSASSALGLQGVIALNVPLVDIGAEVVNLPEAFFDDEALFPKSCVEREEDLSGFVVRGRDGLPPSPASLLLGL